MKFVFLRLFGILLLASLALAACTSKVTQPVNENIQFAITNTPKVIVDEATAMATEDVQSNVESAPQPLDAGVAPDAFPKVASALEAEAALTSGVAFLEDLAPENYDPAVAFAKPGIVTYTIPLEKSAPVIWSYVWCSENTDTLATNFENIQLKFLLDDKEISPDSFGIYETETGEKVCRLIYTSISDWPVGEHHLVTTATFTDKINDGTAEFQPGDYILDYTVYLKS
jgi:hypothetical protein